MAPTDATPRPAEALYPGLRSGPQRLAPDEVAQHQRGRLEGAMVEAVARHGYAATTTRELVALAGVSKSTFYRHFGSKQDCFIATLDTIVFEASRRVTAAYRQADGFRDRLVAALSTFMQVVVEEPAAARLSIVESLTLGTAGREPRERAAEAFELLVRQSYEHSSSKVAVDDVVVRAVVGGIRGVVYRRFRRGNIEELPSLVEELADWALAYQREPGEMTLLAAGAASLPGKSEEEIPPAEATDIHDLRWEEPAGSPRSRAELSQRERIVRAVAQVAVERGYEALSIPAISAAAGVSNQTFYENFEGKREAFLEAFAIQAETARRVAARPFVAAGDSPIAIGATFRAFVEYLERHPLFARLAFFELPAAGPVALDQADATLDVFMETLRPGVAPPSVGGPVSDLVAEATGTAIWTVLQYEIGQCRGDSLTPLAARLSEIALAPFEAKNE